jgi:hypothetical protein
MTKTLKGYKGFSTGLKCRDYQFEVGKEHKHEGDIELCSKGFHFCENPMDVLGYYPLLNDGKLVEIAEVEASGNILTKEGENKQCTDTLKVIAKLDLPMFVKASVDFIWQKAKKGNRLLRKPHATSGNFAHSATSGNFAHSATSGERANSATSGYGAHSATSGNDGIACAVGRMASAKASMGCWIVVAEWKEGNSYTDAKPVCVLSAKVDGKKIKADTFYKVVNKEFVEVKE